MFLALLLLGLRDWITAIASVTLGNGALVLAYIAWLSGTLEYCQRHFKWTPWLITVALVAGAATWFVYIEESFRIRVVIIAGSCALINARHAFIIWQARSEDRDAKALGVPLVAISLTALALVYTLRALHALLYSQGASGLLTQDATQILYTGSFTVCNLMLV